MVTYFNRKDLVSFGSYLLSEKRKSRISELNQNNVTHADIENWKYEQENKRQTIINRRNEKSLFGNKAKEHLIKQSTITAVNQRSELYFAFMEEYNALMGESEHQILKEEVVVLLAKYSG